MQNNKVREALGKIYAAVLRHDSTVETEATLVARDHVNVAVAAIEYAEARGWRWSSDDAPVPAPPQVSSTTEQRLAHLERVVAESHRILNQVLAETPLGARCRRYEVAVVCHDLFKVLK